MPEQKKTPTQRAGAVSYTHLDVYKRQGLGGWIGGFPWVAGPISFFMAWEQGPSFAAATIPAALMGALGTFLFAYSYAVLSKRWSWLPTVLVSYCLLYTSRCV